jgi:hypothetical protein
VENECRFKIKALRDVLYKSCHGFATVNGEKRANMARSLKLTKPVVTKPALAASIRLYLFVLLAKLLNIRLAFFVIHDIFTLLNSIQPSISNFLYEVSLPTHAR